MDDDDVVYEDDMVVTDCPECGGEGDLGEELACSNPDAFFNDAGRHVVAVEYLEGETGPDTMGLRLVESDTASSKKEESPDDPIGVVIIGQDDGLAHRVSRALGGTDGPFTAAMAAQIDEYREALGLTGYPTGCVVGKLWACVLPPLTVGDRGIEVMWLCKALGLEPSKVMTEELMIEAATAANPDFVPGGGEYEFDMFDWLEVL